MKLAVAKRRWYRKRIIIAASGPSLIAEDATICNGETVLAVSDAVRLFPKAEILYSCDAAWWELNRFVPEFGGERWTSHSLAPRNDKRNLPNQELFNIIAGRNHIGFSRDPAFIHYGNNSGFQAVNLGILFGATEIILLGFDMRAVGENTHFFGNHKAPLRATHSYATWINNFNDAAKLLVGTGTRIINCTPGSALKCFPMMPLEEAINGVEK